jgi:tetratricopeptide (TPR) repeat protein
MKMIKRVLAFVVLLTLYVPSSLLAGSDSSVISYNQGLSFFSQNHFDEALAHFLQAADQNFHSWQSYEMAGYCYFQMRDKESALEAFGESLKLNPRNARLVKVYNDLKEGAAVLPLRPVADTGTYLPGT